MAKKRLDLLLLDRGLAATRDQAVKLVMAGRVRVDEQLVFTPAALFTPAVTIQIDQGPRYVSRGGDKLAAALHAFGLARLDERICVDVGASTGGFTDCLIQHGAARVYAVDVGYGELHWRLRNHPRVVVMERTNARYIAGFPEPVSLVTVDASFISLRVLLPVIRRWLPQGGGEVVALIKPQFEAHRAVVSRGEGVIVDSEIHRQVLIEILNFAAQHEFGVRGLIRSPLKGPKGNVEFLAHLAYPGENNRSLDDLIAEALTP